MDNIRESGKSFNDVSNIVLSQEKLRALFLVSQKINQISNIETLLNEILTLAIASIDAERGVVILVDESGEIHRTVASESLEEKEITFSRSVVQKTLTSGEILVSIDVKCDERFKDSDSIIGLNILSFVCVPLVAPTYKHPIGTLYVDQRMHKKVFTNDDIAFLKAFANLAAIAIINANLTEQLKAEKVQLLEEVGKKYSFPSVIGQGKTMQQVLSTMTRIMNDNCTVLVTGESGTGKEVIAKAMHYNGVRKDKPFIAINCGALPETLLEAELFGSVRGAYTGAVDKMGLLQAAQGGTVFLDEIHHTSEAMQVKLLRFLQDKEIRRVGGTKSITVDVRLICASNENLQKAIDDGKFRKDFFYRINVVTINVPPLREHKEDIPLLAEYFLQKYCNEKNKRCRGFSKEALSALIDYDWNENNVRELENEIEHAVIFLSDNSIVKLDDLSQKVQSSPSGLHRAPQSMGTMTYDEFEQKYIQSVLTGAGGNKTRAAKVMGIPRSTLMGKMRRLGML